MGGFIQNEQTGAAMGNLLAADKPPAEVVEASRLQGVRWCPVVSCWKKWWQGSRSTWCGKGQVRGERGTWRTGGFGVSQTIQMMLDTKMQNSESVTEHKTSRIWQEARCRRIRTHWTRALNYQLCGLWGIRAPATQVPRQMSLHLGP